LSSPIKVVHITTVHHPFDTRIYHKECKALKKAGFDVTLIAPETEGIEKSKVKIIPLKKFKNRILRMLMTTIRAYKEAKKLKANIYHFHDPELLPIAWLLKTKNNKVIYDIHEDYVTSILQKQYLSKPVRNLLAKIYILVEKIFSRRMELCLAEKYYLEKYPNGKVILNYPIVYLDNMKKKLNNKKSLNLLYTGNVTLDRGALIHARLPLIDNNITVYYVGKCSKEIADKIYHESAGNSNRIVLKGIDRFVEREEIDDLYKNESWLAGLALFPPTDHYMKKELTKFFEYMSNEIPIICSNFPVWSRFIEKYKCGISVDPFDDKQILEAINFLKDNPEEAKKMGENGKKAVLNELNWAKEEEKLIEWYRELLTN
jgi:glycosyltransferase involved in cell wall biosynthesis